MIFLIFDEVDVYVFDVNKVIIFIYVVIIILLKVFD